MATVRAVPAPPAVPTAEGGAPALPPFPRDGGCGPGRLRTAGPPAGAAVVRRPALPAARGLEWRVPSGALGHTEGPYLRLASQGG